MLEKLEKLLFDVRTKLTELENQLCALVKHKTYPISQDQQSEQKDQQKKFTPFDELPDAVGECPPGYTVFGSKPRSKKCKSSFTATSADNTDGNAIQSVFNAYKPGDKCPTCGHTPARAVDQDVIAECERDKNAFLKLLKEWIGPANMNKIAYPEEQLPVFEGKEGRALVWKSGQRNEIYIYFDGTQTYAWGRPGTIPVGKGPIAHGLPFRLKSAIGSISAGKR